MLDILYFRPTRARCTQLDQAIFDVAAAHRPHVRLSVKHTDEYGYLLGGWVSGTSPSVLLLVEGELVAQFVGELPAREIELLVCSALTASAPAEPLRRAS
jgi:hypothetical protein